jgi:hypothetical protein
MLVFADQKSPTDALKKLSAFGEVVEFKTEGIVYEAIAGHPDIFFCKINQQWVVAPNLPNEYIQKLKEHNISFVFGEEAVGAKYPVSSKYNAVVDNDFLIHNFRNTDSTIVRLGEDMDLIQVDQGYTRCNLIPLGNKNYITSDKGIARTLRRFDLEVLYVDPEGIQLPGYKNGFIGGCVGITDKKIFFVGSLIYHKEGEAIKDALFSQDFEIIELYDGSLFDGGGLIFM